VRPPSRDDVVPGVSEAIDVLTGVKVFGWVRHLGNVGELGRLLDAFVREHGTQLLRKISFGVKPVALGCDRELDLAGPK